MLVARQEMVGGGWSTADRVAAAEGLVGKGAPVVDGRRGVADYLRESEAELMVRSAWAERPWRSGSTVSLRLAGVRVSGGGVPRSGVEETAR